MALKNCRECGTPMSTSADACPKCGAKPARGRALWVVVGVVVLLMVAARMGSDLPNPHARPTPAATAGAKPDRAAQEATFAKHREAVLKVAGDALERDDLAAAGEALDPLPAVRDKDLQALQRTLREKRKAVANKAEIAKLEAQLKTMNQDDFRLGHALYSRLVELAPDNASYQKKLAPLAKKTAKADAEARETIALAMRESLARTTEENFLKQGQSVTITARGKNKTDLQIEYVLVSKAFAYQVQHQKEFIAACRNVGFKRIVLKDGYRETWTITL